MYRDRVYVHIICHHGAIGTHLVHVSFNVFIVSLSKFICMSASSAAAPKQKKERSINELIIAKLQVCRHMIISFIQVIELTAMTTD